MPIDKAKVQAIHDEVRSCFKGQIKSSNKGYDPDFDLQTPPTGKLKMIGAKPGQKGAHWQFVPDQKQRDARILNMKLAATMGFRLRHELIAHETMWRKWDPVAHGFIVLNRKTLVGNCLEMASAAAYLAVRRQVGTPWLMCIQPPGDHVFCLVNEGQKPGAGKVDDFLTHPSDGWVIDPWANVCCPAVEYQQEFCAQMLHWSKQGKTVSANVKYGENENCTHVFDIDPASFDYIKQFRTAPMTSFGGSSSVSSTLPIAIRDKKSSASKPLPGAGGAWSADGDWS